MSLVNSSKAYRMTINLTPVIHQRWLNTASVLHLREFHPWAVMLLSQEIDGRFVACYAPFCSVCEGRTIRVLMILQHINFFFFQTEFHYHSQEQTKDCQQLRDTQCLFGKTSRFKIYFKQTLLYGLCKMDLFKFLDT